MESVDAADRWSGFGVVPEQAFALLRQGRLPSRSHTGERGNVRRFAICKLFGWPQAFVTNGYGPRR
jgi:hypothetical protein